MEHGQQSGGESIGVILSGIAEILREVSEKLDAVAARVDDARDERSVAARLAKLEAWAFRTDQDISKLGARVDGVESGSPREPARADAAPRPEAPSRPEPATRAERRELARAETAEPEASELPQRGGIPQRSGPTPRAESEPRAERPLPRAVANRGVTEPSTRGTAAVAETAFNGERRLPTVPAALNDWVEPSAEPESVERLEPVGITPRGERFTPSGITEAAPTTAPQGMDYNAVRNRADTQDPPRPPGLSDLPTRTPRLDTPAPSRNGRHDDTGRSETVTPASNGRMDSLTGSADYSPHSTGSGRLEAPLGAGFDAPAPNTNGRSESGLTSPRPEPDINTTAPHQRPSAEDNAHVDKLQAMLDELKRNPHGPFGRPLGTPPGELPA
ncbi:hypothetical protein [Nocardia sp. NPDC048505]|uniref:hypothetical protein n=1 Tax=unclassified Nocardia TaxID=2637762 RepID=UPI0033C1F020